MNTKHSVTEYDRKLGALLKQQRIQAGKSQDEVAKILGITFQQVQKYERGLNRVTVSRFSQFSNIYGAQVWDMARDIDGNVMMPAGYDMARAMMEAFGKLSDDQKKMVSHFVRTLAAEKEKA